MNLPLYLKRFGIYYGWVIVFASTLGVIASIPGQTMGISVYSEYLIEALEISRSELSLIYMLATIGSSLLLPRAGRLLDQFGSRILATIACIGLALSILWIASSQQIQGIFKTSEIKPIVAAYFILFVGFLGARHFGQGQLTMASRTMLALWFERRRGLVVGISGVFVSFGFGYAPKALNELIEFMGWVNSLYFLGFSLIFIAFVIAFLFRRSPEDCGLDIEGAFLSEIADVSSHSEGSVADKTLREARRSFLFWLYILGIAGQASIYTGVIFNMGFIATIGNLTTTQAFGVFLPIAVIATSTNLLAGLISRWVPIKYFLITMQLALISGLVSLGYFSSSMGYAFVALGFGVSTGLFSQLITVAWPTLYGRKYLGEISGFATSFMIFGSALGPYLLNTAGETAQGYQLMFKVLILIPCFVIVGCLLTRKS